MYRINYNYLRFGDLPVPIKHLIFCFILSAFLLTTQSGALLAAGTGQIEIVTQDGNVRLSVEYAVTAAEKAKGLMYRKDLPRKHGMLFVYQKPKLITMWMKNTPISLDMIFINRKGRIRYIEKMTQPNSTRQIHSIGKVSAVLELVAGSADDFGISVGDEVKFLNKK